MNNDVKHFSLTNGVMDTAKILNLIQYLKKKVFFKYYNFYKSAHINIQYNIMRISINNKGYYLT